MISVNTFGKINHPPLKYLPCIVLSKPSVGKTCFIESGSTLKAPNLYCLAASDRKVKTLLTITLWLNLIMNSRTTLPHLDKGRGEKEYLYTFNIYILKWLSFLKKVKMKKNTLRFNQRIIFDVINQAESNSLNLMSFCVSLHCTLLLK